MADVRNKKERPKRVIAYVDGFNLYFGLKSKGWKDCYWLNIQLLIKNLLKPAQILMKTKYFTARVSSPSEKQKRQATFIEALGTLKNFQIFYGHYLTTPYKCRQCGATYSIIKEKMTDVNIAVEMLTDASKNIFDVAILISADSDLRPVLSRVKTLFPDKKLIVFFHPNRFSKALKDISNECFDI